VTDPTHPLFGRHFQLIAIFAPLQTPGHVLVAYRQQMVLSIPLLATNLSLPRPGLATKLTSQALTELMSLAEECEVLSCPTDPKTSGGTGLHRSKAKSSRTSSRSIVRDRD
jgi:hypothetical protein